MSIKTLHAALAAELDQSGFSGVGTASSPPAYDFGDCGRSASVIATILRERARQDQLVADGRHPFSCADSNIPGSMKLPVLAEEFGEVAKALYELDNELVLDPTATHNLRTELTQCAAVCVAWLQSLSVKSV